MLSTPHCPAHSNPRRRILQVRKQTQTRLISAGNVWGIRGSSSYPETATAFPAMVAGRRMGQPQEAFPALVCTKTALVEDGTGHWSVPWYSGVRNGGSQMLCKHCSLTPSFLMSSKPGRLICDSPSEATSLLTLAPAEGQQMCSANLVPRPHPSRAFVSPLSSGTNRDAISLAAFSPFCSDGEAGHGGQSTVF